MAVQDKYSLYFKNAIDEYVKKLDKCDHPDLKGIETPNTFRNNRGQAMYVRMVSLH